MESSMTSSRPLSSPTRIVLASFSVIHLPPAVPVTSGYRFAPVPQPAQTGLRHSCFRSCFRRCQVPLRSAYRSNTGCSGSRKTCRINDLKQLSEDRHMYFPVIDLSSHSGIAMIIRISMKTVNTIKSAAYHFCTRKSEIAIRISVGTGRLSICQIMTGTAAG